MAQRHAAAVLVGGLQQLRRRLVAVHTEALVHRLGEMAERSNLVVSFAPLGSFVAENRVITFEPWQRKENSYLISYNGKLEGG